MGDRRKRQTYTASPAEPGGLPEDRRRPKRHSCTAVRVPGGYPKRCRINSSRSTMARFLAPEAFSAATEDLSLLPFNLERTGTHQYLVANMVGDFIRLTEDELNRLIDLRIRPGDGLYEKAYAAHLITGTNQKAQRQLLAARLRSRMSFLQQVTPLHIFVVTLRCEHSCPYCQVSRQSTDRSRFDMSEETAMRALDIAFASPARRIKIEIQAGERLLNFPIIRTLTAAPLTP